MMRATARHGLDRNVGAADTAGRLYDAEHGADQDALFA